MDKYYYNGEYYTFDEIRDMYQKLEEEQHKPFRDALAHFSLLEILKKCNYDKKIIEGIEELAGIEAGIIGMYGSDCGFPMMKLRGVYNSNLRKLINLTGKLVDANDKRIDEFNNGEWLLNNIVCLTIGPLYPKDIEGDLILVNYNLLSEEECLAISDNFIRCMKDEEIVFYQEHRSKKR